MDWKLILLAGCLMLLCEGIPLFIAPKKVRASAATLLQLDDLTLRLIGLVAMLVGVGLMVVINA